MIRFGAPEMLAIGVPLALLVIWRVRSLPATHAGVVRRLVQLAMILASVTAALAIARPELGRSIDRMSVVFLLDESRSVQRSGEHGAPEALDQIQRAIEGMEDGDSAALVVFGAEPATLVAPSARPTIRVVRASIPRDATDIAAAIRRGLAELPSGSAPRVILLSDGNETEGDALDAAQAASGRGVPIDTWAVERAPGAEVAIERVRMPAVADPGQAVELRIVTRATADTRVRVRVSRDGESIAVSETEVRASADVLTLRELAPEPGVHRYEVVLEPLDASVDLAPENNEGGALIRVTGGSRALILAAEPEEARGLEAALQGAGMDTERGDASRLPADLAELAAFDLIALSDLPARAFTDAQMSELAAYVRDLGGGLLMAGARQSFGLGGYALTPIEEVLPASFDLRRRRDRASLAMVIAIDKSGSMTVEAAPGTTKLALANEAAARSAMLLSPLDRGAERSDGRPTPAAVRRCRDAVTQRSDQCDRVGVAHIDTEVSWTLPMTVVDDPRRIAAVVRRAQPGGGGILIDPTLEASYGVLRQQPSQLKHLLLFSDGEDSEQMVEARRLVAAAARDRITTSIVSMGAGADTPELEQLSRIGGGRFYIVEDMTELPRIFTEETIAASRAALVTEPFRARPAEPGAATRGIDFAAAPPLEGHAVVNARPRASILLAATEEDPLLLEHQHGVGRSAVFATDTGAAFARPWLSWSGYSALFGQLGRSIARSPERRDARVDVTLQGGSGRVIVEAMDEGGHTRNYLELGATIAGPSGGSQRVALTQTGAGRYEGRFEADAPGAYLVTVREGEDELVGSAGVVRARGDELRGEGTDHALLARIAALTGGQVRDDLEGVFRERPASTFAYEPVWRPLVIASILLLLASVALRRLVLPGARRADAPVPVATAPAPAPSTIEPPPPAPPSAPPASLAETLLARKKTR